MDPTEGALAERHIVKAPERTRAFAAPAKSPEDGPAESAPPRPPAAPAPQTPLVWPPLEEALQRWEVISSATLPETDVLATGTAEPQAAPEPPWVAQRADPPTAPSAPASDAEPDDVVEQPGSRDAVTRHEDTPAHVHAEAFVEERLRDAAVLAGLQRAHDGLAGRGSVRNLEEDRFRAAAPSPDVATRALVGRFPREVAWWVPLVVLVVGAGAGFAAGWWMRSSVVPVATTANVSVETTPPGAQVAVDGTLRGTSPVRLQLPPGERRLTVTSGGTKREALLQLTAGADVVRVFEFASAPAPVQTGSLEIQTRPPGAQVVIAGQPRGVTPLTVTGLAAGIHDVQLSTAERSLTQRVEVSAGRNAVLVVPMTGTAGAASGWLAVRSSVPLRLFEAGRVVGTTEMDRIMLPAGRHDLELVNDRLEVRLTRSLMVQGGRELTLTVPVPQGQVSINAQPWAEVFVGEQRLGETPLGNVSLPVGEHDIVFRHPQFGERRQPVTVRAATPARVSVTFRP